MELLEHTAIELEALKLELKIKVEQIDELNNQVADLETLIDTNTNMNTSHLEAKIEKAMERALNAEEELAVCSA